MTLVTTTLQRLFARRAAPRRAQERRAKPSGNIRSLRPDFAETRPLVFRSEAFAEDLTLSHGAA